jgi:hypothetical protein
VSGSDTNENRGYMLSGFCSNVTGNSGHINRQKAGTTPYETVDGEGILHQSENGNAGYGCGQQAWSFFFISAMPSAVF